MELEIQDFEVITIKTVDILRVQITGNSNTDTTIAYELVVKGSNGTEVAERGTEVVPNMAAAALLAGNRDVINMFLAQLASGKTVEARIVPPMQLKPLKSGNNNLSSITIEGIELTPSFDKFVTEYSGDVANDISQINISVAKEDEKASVQYQELVELQAGINQVSIIVTSENGVEKIYTLSVNRLS